MWRNAPLMFIAVLIGTINPSIKMIGSGEVSNFSILINRGLISCDSGMFVSILHDL
jgi:hypothetical protein